MSGNRERNARRRFFSSHAPFLEMCRRAGRYALDLVFPPACLACRRAVAEHFALCPDCWRKIRFIERPFCERLGLPFALDLGQPGLISPQAAADPPVFARARAVARFDDGPARLLIHRLKYYDRLDIARPLGRWMARAGADILAEADLLAPVPLHRTRLFSRRYNQAALLATAVSRETGVPVMMRALERVRATPPQIGLSRARRAANMRGAFQASDDAKLLILNQRVVLIDDVLTSGSTANAAARALMRAGAAQVDLLTFARVVVDG